MATRIQNPTESSNRALFVLYVLVNILLTNETLTQEKPLRPPRDRPVTTTTKIPKETTREESHAPVASRPPRPSPQPIHPCPKIYIEPAFSTIQEIVVEPSEPTFVAKEDVSWSLWYVGAQVGNVWPQGDVAQEYQRGSTFGGVTGFILESGLGFEIGLQQGSLTAAPQFDYVTTRYYPDGTVAATKEIPERMMASSTSLGIKASYQMLRRDVGSHLSSGWRIGASLRYLWFDEEAMLTQEKSSDERIVSNRLHSVENSFQHPVFGIEISSTTAFASSWWIDLTAGYDFASNSPQRALPTVFDWNQYTGQFSVGVALKINMGSLPRGFLTRQG